MPPKKKPPLKSEWPPNDRAIWGVILALGLAATFGFFIPVVFYALPLTLSAAALGLVVRALVTRSTLADENDVEPANRGPSGKEMALRGFAITFVILGFIAGFVGLAGVDKARNVFNEAAKTREGSGGGSGVFYDKYLCNQGFYEYC